MSLRPEICGFDCERFFKQLGSGDQGLIRSIQRNREHSDAGQHQERDETSRSMFDAALCRAVHDGVPFVDLDDEGPVHVRLAIELAWSSQELLRTESSSWKYQAFPSFFKDHSAELDPRGRSLLGCFLKGRPIFGKRIVTGWSYYGHLHRRDTLTLRDSIRSWLDRPLRERTNAGSRAFAEDFVGWLDIIDSARCDLWFWFE